MAVALASLGLALGAAGSAQAWDAGSITKTSGPVTATLTWGGAEFGVTQPALTITRDAVAYPITIDDICLEGCVLVADDAHTAPGTSTLKVADLDGDGEPEVLVDTFSGGAHCCVTLRVLTFNGTGYSPADVDWRDTGYTLRDADGDGRPDLVGGDPRFAGAFTAFAASTWPVQILHADHGTLSDVTRLFPKAVRTDLTLQRRYLRKAVRIGDDVRGVLASYVADEYLLGQGAKGLAELDHQRRAKRIRPSYRRLLLRELHAWGYR